MERLIQSLEQIVGVVTESISSAQEKAGSLQVPTELNGDEYNLLLDALMSAFVDEEALALMVKRTFQKKLNLITQGASNYEVMVDKLIEWAQSNGQLQKLMEGSLQRNPGNPNLKALVQTWGLK